MLRAWTVVLVSVVFGASAVQAQQPQLTPHDQVRIAVQRICPVSGKPLGEHGTPIKVRVGKETVYLCCRGCLRGRINQQAWQQIHANFRAAQGICPVMKKPLPRNAKGAPVQGEMFYVCCPGCLRKIAANPQKYHQWLEGQYRAALKKTASAR